MTIVVTIKYTAGNPGPAGQITQEERKKGQIPLIPIRLSICGLTCNKPSQRRRPTNKRIITLLDHVDILAGPEKYKLCSFITCESLKEARRQGLILFACLFFVVREKLQLDQEAVLYFISEIK